MANAAALAVVQPGKGAANRGAQAVRDAIISVAPHGHWYDIGQGAGEYATGTDFTFF